MTSMVKGPPSSRTTSQRPVGRNSSICWSTRDQMKASFSASRFGVSRRISRPRCAVCFGGSIVVIWSLNGRLSRCSSMRSVTSSPSSGTGMPGKGPVTAVHEEKVAVSW